MGLFSGDTIIVTGASITPLVTESPNIIRQAILRATINGWEKVPTIVDGLINGLNVDFEAFYRYGRDKYSLGLMYNGSVSESVDADPVKAYIASVYGFAERNIFIIFNEFERPFSFNNGFNYVHVMHKYMELNSTSRDYITGYYSGFAGAGTNLVEAIELVFASSDGSGVLDIMRLSYWEFAEGNRNNAVLKTIDIADPDYEDEYDLDFDTNCLFITYNVPGSVDLYFSFSPERHPEEDFSTDVAISGESPLFPLVPLRKNNFWIGEDPEKTQSENDADIVESKKILKTLDIDLDTMIEGLSDNPDVETLDYAYLSLCFILSTNVEVRESSAKYLYKQLLKYYGYFPDAKTKYLDSLDRLHINGATIHRTKINIFATFEDELGQHAYSPLSPFSGLTTLMWNYIEETNITYSVDEPEYKFGKHIDPTDKYRDEGLSQRTDLNSYIYVDHHDHSSGVAKRITIYGLALNHPFYKGRESVYTLIDVFPLDGRDPQDGIFIPLDIKVLEELSIKEANEVTFYGLSLIAQDVEKFKTKWYQSNAFIDFIQIVVIVVSVIYMSPQLGAAINAGVKATAIFILESIASGYLIGEALRYGLTFLVEAIGGDAALILAVIATAVSAYYGYTGQTFAYLPTAEEMLKIVTMMFDTINEVTLDEYQELQEEYSEFLTEYKEAMELIEEAQDGLLDVGIDPAWITRNTGLLPNETPDMFYQRTVGMPNPGIYSIDAVSNFYEDQLTLPSTASSGLTL